jgi:hypothetical protein
MNDNHGVLFPRLARRLVSDATPQVNQFLSMVKNATGTAQLSPSTEVLGKRFAHSFKARADVTFYIDIV